MKHFIYLNSIPEHSVLAESFTAFFQDCVLDVSNQVLNILDSEFYVGERDVGNHFIDFNPTLHSLVYNLDRDRVERVVVRLSFHGGDERFLLGFTDATFSDELRIVLVKPNPDQIDVFHNMGRISPMPAWAAEVFCNYPIRGIPTLIPTFDTDSLYRITGVPAPSPRMRIILGSEIVKRGLVYDEEEIAAITIREASVVCTTEGQLRLISMTIRYNGAQQVIDFPDAIGGYFYDAHTGFSYETNAFARAMFNLACEGVLPGLTEEDLRQAILRKGLENLLMASGERYVFAEEGVVFPSKEDHPLIRFDGDRIFVMASRRPDETAFTEFSLAALPLKKASFGEALRSLLFKPSSQILSWQAEYENALEGERKIVDRVLLLQSCLERGKTIPEPRRNEEFALQMLDAEERIEELGQYDFTNVNQAADLIRQLDSAKSKEAIKHVNERIQDLYFNEMTDQDRLEIDEEYQRFTSFISDIMLEESPSKNEVFRDVFVSKKAFDEYLESDPLLQRSIEKMVRDMKRLPTKDLMRYFVCHQINQPKGINKIRIPWTENVARLCFLYGSDLGDREFTKSSIYIVRFTKTAAEHDRINDILETVANRPYAPNDFFVFPSSETAKKPTLTFPECENYQFKVSDTEVGPMVAYGCAGSGKTIVSINQYKRIATKILGTVQPKETDIAYVTFSRSLASHVAGELDQNGIEAHCYSLMEYFNFVGGLKLKRKPSQAEGQIGEIRETDEQTFQRWFKETYEGENKKKFKRSSRLSCFDENVDIPELVYTYYRGIFKGSPELLGTKEKHLDKKQFLRAMEDCGEDEYLGEKTIQSIFDICCDFYDAKGKEAPDDNEAALLAYAALKADKGRKVRYVIVDEVQDLTAVQLRAILASLQGYDLERQAPCMNAFFYGDPHQTINPTVFTDSDLNKAVHEENGKMTLNENTSLCFTYRVKKELHTYLHKLENHRREWLGHRMENLGKVEAKDDRSTDTLPIKYSEGNELNDEAIRRAVNSSTTIVIVPNEQTKEDLATRLALSQNEAARIFTIFQAKGIEWEQCVLYKMIGKSLRYFEDMSEGKAPHSTIHRMAFNKFFVSCTRSTSNFIIAEDSVKPDVYKDLLDGLTPLENTGEVDLYLKIENTYEGWIEEAKKLIEKNQGPFAMAPLNRASAFPDLTEKQKNEINHLRAAADETLSEQECLEFGEIAMKEKDFQGALLFFRKGKNEKMAALARLYLGSPIEDSSLYEALLNEGLLDQDPERAYPLLTKQPCFYETFNKTLKRLKGE